MAEGSLSNRSARGGAYALGGQLISLVIQMLSLAVLARMLGAEEYGLLAMVMAAIGVAEIFRDFGLTTAAIQAKELSNEERTNLWWWNTAIGSVLALVILASAPLIAAFYQDDRLILITAAMSLNFVLSGMGAQYYAYLQREIRFGALSLTGIVSSLSGLGSAVALAAAGHGVWALVSQTLVGSAVTLIMYIAQTRWIPGWYSRQTSMKKFFNFGLPLFGSSLIQYVAGSSDVLLLGRFVAPEILGYYNRAAQSMRTPITRLRNPLSNVAFTTLVKKQGDDKALAGFAEQGQIIIGYPIVLLSFGMAAAAPFVIELVLGMGWEAAVVFFALLSIGEGMNTLAMTAGWIFMSKGKTKSLFHLTLASGILRAICIVIGLVTMGAVGVALAGPVSMLIQWPCSLVWTKYTTGVSTRGLIVNSYRIFCVSGFAALVTFGVAQLLIFNAFVSAIICVVVHLIAAGLCAVIPAVRRDYMSIFNMAKKMKK